MGPVTFDQPSDLQQFSGFAAPNPTAIYSRLDQNAVKSRAIIRKDFSGVHVEFHFGIETPSGSSVVIEESVASQGNSEAPTIEDAVSSICRSFSLSKAEVAFLCDLKSRKTLYNWASGESVPRPKNARRLFDLYGAANAFSLAGHIITREQLDKPILKGRTIRELISQSPIDYESVLFAGAKFDFGKASNRLHDPFV